jgi:membrane protein implicated in regulation of membrane protease activity
MDAWMFWILLAVVLAAGEIMTLSFFLAPFAAGALLGALADMAGAGGAVAVIVFLVSSGLLFGLLRPVARRHLRTPAKTAMVTERIDAQGGAVKLDGEVWTARAYLGDEVIEAGSCVQVVEIRGATALVSENG